MKSLRQLHAEPIGLPLIADDVTELHAARILLLLKLCGINGRIEGLTKLAKLDFFVRYPAFFKRAAQHLNRKVEVSANEVDSEMIRHHYGPWDKRYYSVLPFLESHRLITVSKDGGTFIFVLSDSGKEAAKKLERRDAFSDQVARMREVKKILGNWKGTSLKDLVYELFDKEVGRKSLGEVIR